MSTDLLAYSDWLLAHRFRGLLWIAGERTWCQQQVTKRLSALTLNKERVVLVSDQALDTIEPLSPQDSQRLLGRQVGLGIFDAFCGFNPNRFAHLSGAISAGGWLVLLSPPLTEWRNFDDPEYQKIVPEPWTPHQVTPAFVPRLVRELGNSQSVVSLLQGDGDEGYLQLPEVTLVSKADPPRLPTGYLSADQFRCVRSLQEIMQQKRGCAVVHADRGRGKSSALGILLGLMANQAQIDGHSLRVAITAPDEKTLWALIERLQERLPTGNWHNGAFLSSGVEVLYYSPSQVIEQNPVVDLLIVDEAAAIPTPQLERFAASYTRVIFATTEHGYEGNGRGFTLRFLPTLQRLRSETRLLSLQQPVRWANGDPLEQVVNRLLLLDAEPSAVHEVEVGESIEIERLGEKELAQESVLRQLYGLLVLAHYRTSPGDLRLLLDAPNLDVYVLRAGGHIAGAVLVAREGELPSALAQAVWEGRRRPRGQLLPQTLIAHEGWLEISAWKGWRIMRVAVHPVVQRLGHGTRLLRYLRREAEEAGVDYLGASFSASAELLRFWRRNHYLPLRVGDQVDPVTGAHAGVVMQPISERASSWFTGARQQYGERLRYRLSGSLRELAETDLPELFVGLDRPELSDADLRLLKGFAKQLRPLECTLPALDRLLQKTVSLWGHSPLNEEQVHLMVSVIWRQRFPRLGGALSGRRAQIKALREICAQLLALNSH